VSVPNKVFRLKNFHFGNVPSVSLLRFCSDADLSPLSELGVLAAKEPVMLTLEQRLPLQPHWRLWAETVSGSFLIIRCPWQSEGSFQSGAFVHQGCKDCSVPVPKQGVSPLKNSTLVIVPSGNRLRLQWYECLSPLSELAFALQDPWYCTVGATFAFAIPHWFAYWSETVNFSLCQSVAFSSELELPNGGICPKAIAVKGVEVFCSQQGVSVEELHLVIVPSVSLAFSVSWCVTRHELGHLPPEPLNLRLEQHLLLLYLW